MASARKLLQREEAALFGRGILMKNEQYSLIETLTFNEIANLPVLGTLIEQIVYLLNSNIVFSDIIIHQNSPSRSDW